MRIDHCICTQRPFVDLLDQAQRDNLSLHQLIQKTGASACCTMCGPYLRRAYRTGQTFFDDFLDQDDEPLENANDIKVATLKMPPPAP
ncbi:MAG: hypothetical protein V3V20_09600 [Algisphaera sp.]